ncbi:hypothetical protein GOBAR_AA11386 [Gossypium barbadense]|uniref:Uncharacterized protein n=1 Tax=Gossypium barbadense TaxID=3634 RepID=A0A2P5Y132_GOSBA|nr:hypothetical protein GOBAR_AA11386 [Gossypium barbadense]
MHKGKRPDSSHGGRLAEGLAPNVWEGLQGPTFTSEEGLQKGPYFYTWGKAYKMSYFQCMGEAYGEPTFIHTGRLMECPTPKP